MSETERVAALEAIQLELFALERKYGDIVADFYIKKREIMRRRARLLSTGEKRCRKCNEVKGVREFYKETRYADERRPYCIACERARQNASNEVKRKANVLSCGSQSEAA